MKSFSSHSPNQQNYYIKAKVIKLPKFEFEYPPSLYGLKVMSSKTINKTELQPDTSTESALPSIIYHKIREKQSQQEIQDRSILVGNSLNSMPKRVVKPKLPQQFDIFPLKALKKKLIKLKFNGIYFEDEKFCTDPDFQLQYANLRTYYNVINLSNNLYVQPTLSLYKAYIGKGNNGQLVKWILKSRWWWSIIESDKQTSNFLWQQLRNDSYMEHLPESKELPVQFSSNLTEQSLYESRAAYEKLIPISLNFELQRITKKIGKNSKILNYEQAQTFSCNLRYLQVDSNIKLHNHIQNNSHLGSKKYMFYNLKKYYDTFGLNVFDVVPLTFHICSKEDLLKFVETNCNTNNTNIWIVKPAELTNRGNGIHVFESKFGVQQYLKNNHFHKNGIQKSFIVQKYIDNPLLYNQRKFDIRCYMLFTSINGQQKGFWYEEGYIRTSSKQFNLKNLTNKLIHLTNDAVQKHSNDYGKFEKGNKISFEEIDNILPIDFYKVIYPQLKSIAFDLLKSTYGKLDPRKKENAFELFGLDFMIDQEYKVWLIEANTNPCLEQSGPLLSKLIPELIENLLKLVVDPIFPPPPFYNARKFIYSNLENKFQLIFDPTTFDLHRQPTSHLIEEQ